MLIETKLCHKTKLDAYNPLSDRQEFLRQLILAVDKLSKADWDSLPIKAQDWANSAAQAYKNKTAIPEPDLDQVLINYITYAARESCAELLEPLLTKDAISKEDITSIIDKLLSHKRTKIS